MFGFTSRWINGWSNAWFAWLVSVL